MIAKTLYYTTINKLVYTNFATNFSYYKKALLIKIKYLKSKITMTYKTLKMKNI